ncbi:MAG TPA: PglZ domain-containing protein, partial [Dehalococcoidia bacterium]|nr:PglZ domain-containing protein [Dehalococcoidia bacterium]
ELPAGELAAALLVLALTASEPADVASRALDAVFGASNEPVTALRGLRAELIAGLGGQPAFVGVLDERAVTALPSATLARSVLGADTRPPGEIAALLGSLPTHAAEALAAAAVQRFGAYGLDPLLWELSSEATAPGTLLGAPVSAVGALVAALRALGELVHVAEEQPPAGGLQTLAEAWSASALCRAETRLSALRERLLPLLPESVRSILESFGVELRRRIRDRVEAWDMGLAALLAEPGGLGAYHTAPCALPFAQRDLHARPTGDTAALFLVVMDGMRLDTWQEIVRPILGRAFAVQRSECRLVTLPSYTVISRTAFFAGAQPDRWRGPSGAFTSQERELAAVALGLSGSERDSALLYETQASAHPEDRPATALRRRYTLLVYNVCDDLVHEFQGSLWQLQSEIAHRVREQVLPDLQQRVRPGDVLLITSDHGFFGLDSADAVDVPPGSAEQASDVVKYRLIERPSTDEGLVVDWGPAGRFRLAYGRQWFRRAGGSSTPFSHGGLSWHEITVPAALLTLATAPVYRLLLQRDGAPPSAIEGQPVALPVLVRNAGNRSLQVRLETRSADFSVEPSRLTLAPGERRTVVVQAFGQTRPGAYTAELFAGYAAVAADNEAAMGGERVTLPFTVEPDPGRVELSSALDIFDDELGDLG